MGALTTQWIASGVAQQILDGVRAESHARQQLARRLLPGPFPAAAAGIHLWQPLPDRWTAADLERVARDEGLSVTSSEALDVYKRQVTLCVAAPRDLAPLPAHGAQP